MARTMGHTTELVEPIIEDWKTSYRSDRIDEIVLARLRNSVYQTHTFVSF